MKTSFLLSCLLILAMTGCAGESGDSPSSDDMASDASMTPMLATGDWNGGLVPMNHPDLRTPLVFTVSYEDEVLAMTLGGPDGGEIPIRNAHVDGDTLRFEFNEPEVGVLLTCALAGMPAEGFEGKCSDDADKWALVTMTPPGA